MAMRCLQTQMNLFQAQQLNLLRLETEQERAMK